MNKEEAYMLMKIGIEYISLFLNKCIKITKPRREPILSPSERPSFEMPGRTPQVAQNRVPYVPVCVSPGPGVGIERTTKILPKHKKRCSRPNSLEHLKYQKLIKLKQKKVDRC